MRVAAPGRRWQLSHGGDSFRGLLEFLVFRTMQELGNIQQDDETAFEFAYTGDIARFAVGKNGAGRFNFGRRNFQDFRSGVDDKPDQFVVQFHDENTVFLVVLNFRLAEAFAQVHHRNNFAAKVDDTLDGVRSVGNRSDFRYAHDFANGADAHTERFIADAKTNDLKFLFHNAISRHFRNEPFPNIRVLVHPAA